MNQIPFKTRLKAWWEGYNFPSSRPVKVRRPIRRGVASSRFDPATEINHLLFGEGQVMPAAPDPLGTLPDPVMTTEDSVVLMIGTESGGPAFAQARQPGRLVLMEPDPRLRAIAEKLAEKHQFNTELRFGSVDLERLEIATRAFDVVISRMVLNRLMNRDPIYEGIERGLRRGGQAVLTLLTLADSGRADEILGILNSNREEPPVHILSVSEESQLLTESGMRVLSFEDQTDQFVTSLKQSFRHWQELVETLQRYEESAGLLQALLELIEYWQSRIDLMESGALQVTRFLAAKRENELLD